MLTAYRYALLFFLVLASEGVPASDDAPERRCGYSFRAIRKLLDSLESLNSENAIRAVPYKPDTESWQVDGKYTNQSPQYNYNSYFQEALDGKTLEELAGARRKDGKTAHVADFFGSAVFSGSPTEFNSLTGVRLKPLDRHYRPKPYPAENWKEVTGDAYTSKLWTDLTQSMGHRNIPHFDVILCRPVGPLSTTGREAFKLGNKPGRTAFLTMNGLLLGRMWEKLSADDGLMLVQITPEVENNREFKAWLEKARAQGLEADIVHNNRVSSVPHPILRIRKTKTSPAEFPL